MSNPTFEEVMSQMQAAQNTYGQAPRPAALPTVDISSDKIKLIKEIRTRTGWGLKEAKDAMDVVIESLNSIRTPDTRGTLRKRTDGLFAFAVSDGDYLLIDPANERFKKASPREATDAKGWTLITKG